MFLSNCLICKKPFVKLSRDICSNCVAKEKQYLQTIKEYLSKNTGASLEDISKFTKVDKVVVNQFIREGKISIAMSCQRCGAKMQAADPQKLCYKCKKSVVSDFRFVSTKSPRNKH